MELGRAEMLTQLRRGTVEYCVLALLRGGEQYALDLVRELAQHDVLVVSEGTIYPLLSRLRRDGLVETAWQESPAGPPRRYHRLTEQGRRALQVFEQEWTGFRTAVDAILSPTKEIR